MTYIKRTFCIIIINLLTGFYAGIAWADHNFDHVRIQLPATANIQQAGYYMALHKGFFTDQGLTVRLVEANPLHSVVTAVASGQVEYGVSNANILIAKANGSELVAIAAIFQHSPAALLILKDKGITELTDLHEKRVLLQPELQDIELISLLRKLQINSVNISSPSSSRDITTLVNNQFDAFSLNLTSGPYNYLLEGVEPLIFMPKDYGIDFYSGYLFTSAAELNLNPDRVEAIRAAVLQGWEYALTHTEETLDVMLKLNRQLPEKAQNNLRQRLNYQLISLRDFILPDFIPLGYINKQHLQNIVKQLTSLGFIHENVDFSQFIYTPPTDKIDWRIWGTWIKIIVAALLFNGLWLSYLLVVNQRLKQEIKERRRAEQRVRHAAMHDNLTGLANRGQLMDTLQQILPLAQQGKLTPVLLFMDLDRFKLVNDRYGHAAGDELLIAVAQRITRLLGMPGELLTRLGGDEFVILLPDSDLGYARLLSEKIERTLLQSFALTVCNVSIGISIGYCVYRNNMTADELLTGADNLMYVIKSEHHQQRKPAVC